MAAPSGATVKILVLPLNMDAVFTFIRMPTNAYILASCVALRSGMHGMPSVRPLNGLLALSNMSSVWNSEKHLTPQLLKQIFFSLELFSFYPLS